MIETINEWLIDYWNWYYLMISISIIIGIYASYIHNTGIPLLFTALMGVILHYGYEYLNPMLLNISAFETNTLLGYMLTALSIIWVLIFSLAHYNLIMYAEVVK